MHTLIFIILLQHQRPAYSPGCLKALQLKAWSAVLGRRQQLGAYLTLHLLNQNLWGWGCSLPSSPMIYMLAKLRTTAVKCLCINLSSRRQRLPSHNLAAVRNEGRKEDKAEAARFGEGGVGPWGCSLAAGTQTQSRGAGDSFHKPGQTPEPHLSGRLEDAKKEGGWLFINGAFTLQKCSLSSSGFHNCSELSWFSLTPKSPFASFSSPPSDPVLQISSLSPVLITSSVSPCDPICAHRFDRPSRVYVWSLYVSRELQVSTFNLRQHFLPRGRSVTSDLKCPTQIQLSSSLTPDFLSGFLVLLNDFFHISFPTPTTLRSNCIQLAAHSQMCAEFSHLHAFNITCTRNPSHLMSTHELPNCPSSSF